MHGSLPPLTEEAAHVLVNVVVPMNGNILSQPENQLPSFRPTSLSLNFPRSQERIECCLQLVVHLER
jgi:hypothetical protein